MMENIGASLRTTRNDISMSVEKLSEITGYSKRTIYRYEQNDLLPSLLFVVELARLRGCTVDSIIRQ